MKHLIILLLVAWGTWGAMYPLEITNIKPVGTGAPAMTAGNRIFKAYPNIEYNIQTAVIGGVFPYKFYLTMSPQGMVIDSLTGEINWPNPQTSDSATVVVIDKIGSSDTATWSIEVTTTGFIFIDSSVAVVGDGSIDSPFKEMWDIMGDSKTDDYYKEYIVYFRKGTYLLQGYYDNPESPYRIAYYDKPTVWMAYPNERVVIDFDTQNVAQWQPNIYQEGFTIKNCGGYGFDNGGDYSTYRKLKFINLIDYNPGSNNQSFLCLRSGGHTCLVDSCEFEQNTICNVKLYHRVKLLMQRCLFLNESVSEGLAIKMGIDTVVVRENKFSPNNNPAGTAISIDAYEGTNSAGCRHIDISFNLAYNQYRFLKAGANGYLGATQVRRNTVVNCGLQIYYVDTLQGPVSILDNVLINSYIDNGDTTSGDYYRNKVWFRYSPHIYNKTVLIYNNIMDSSANSIVDTNNNYFLIGEYLQFVDSIGYQFENSDSYEIGPTIIKQPSDTTIDAGDSATFICSAVGTSPLYYKWICDGDSVGNTNILVLRNNTEDNSGKQYWCIVSNDYGYDTSNIVTLSVNPPPHIIDSSGYVYMYQYSISVPVTVKETSSKSILFLLYNHNRNLVDSMTLSPNSSGIISGAGNILVRRTVR